MAVSVELTVNDTTEVGGRYVTWAPARCTVRVLNADGLVGPIAITLANRVGPGGKVVFRSTATAAATDRLSLTVPASGGRKTFFVSGRFGSPSIANGDAAIEVQQGTPPAVIASIPVMVRVRKNAERLTTAERDRFLSAMARLNDHGTGIFRSFRATHTDDTSNEAHGDDGFLPWHRAYLLDLERELQKLDPSVTLPYWRFDQPAPKLFRTSFLGAPDPATGLARFTPANPLSLWSTDGIPGIERFPLFNSQTSPASNSNGPVIGEAAIVGSAVAYRTLRGPLEGNPHGRAHTCFAGVIASIGTAARDPLFFLLHCNVDRLWAKWQWFQHRFDPTSDATYHFRGSASSPGATRIGHNLLDTMWPWNNVKTGLRPRTAPRTPFPAAPTTPAPGPKPDVRAMIDFQGHRDPAGRLGFDYDDVPFESLAP